MQKSMHEVLKETVEDTPYGRFLIEYFREVPNAPVFFIDNLREIVGINKAYKRIHKGASKEAFETPILEKIKIAKKALKAVEDVREEEKRLENKNN